MNNPSSFRHLVLGLLAVLALGACSAAAAPSSSSAPATQSPTATASATPSDNTGDGTSGDPGQTDPSATIGGVILPTPVDPGVGQSKLVIARPGQLNPRPVGAASLEPAVTGHHVLVKVTWWSGVEPCNVLDSVQVDRSGTDITIQLIEGTSDANAICMEMAEQKSTIVDLGEFEPGTYTIFPGGKGDALPVTFKVT
jgi:ABC-type transport system substrate-binding protein